MTPHAPYPIILCTTSPYPSPILKLKIFVLFKLSLGVGVCTQRNIILKNLNPIIRRVEQVHNGKVMASKVKHQSISIIGRIQDNFTVCNLNLAHQTLYVNLLIYKSAILKGTSELKVRERAGGRQ